MKQKFIFPAILLFLILLSVNQWAEDNCSSYLVTKGASKDGSVMITYTCDGEFLPHLELVVRSSPHVVSHSFTSLVVDIPHELIFRAPAPWR